MKLQGEQDIIGEIHQTRERLAAKFDHDAAAFFADLMKRQKTHGSRLVSPLREPGKARSSKP